jgi:hypothetical protein
MKKSGKGKWSRARKFEVVIALIAAALGFVAGFATRYELNFHIQFDDKINPVELLSLACTIVLAWIVASVLDKQKEAEKSSREILLKRTEEFASFVVRSASRAASENFSYPEAASITKRIDVKLNRLWQVLESVEISYDRAMKASMVKQIDKMDELLTDIQPPALVVRNDLIRFSPERSVQVETAFDDLLDMITSLQLAVIRG